MTVSIRTLLDALHANRALFLNFLSRRIDDRATAEDLLQEALWRGHERIGELRSPDAVTGWFFQILRNAVVDHHRRTGTATRALERFASESSEVVEVEKEPRVCKCVGKLVGELKPEYADALRRVEVDGLAMKDAADQLGITKGNAAVRVFRAREALRKRVVSTCGACAATGCTDCSCGGQQPEPT